jgi:hypothetical protein
VVPPKPPKTRAHEEIIDIAAKERDESIELLKLQVLAMQQENEKLKKSRVPAAAVVEPCIQEVPMAPAAAAIVPQKLTSQDLVSEVKLPAPVTIHSDFMTELAKKFYLDNIGLKAEIDIFEHEAREQFTARRRAEAKAQQVEAAALFGLFIRRILFNLRFNIYCIYCCGYIYLNV